MLHLSVPSDPGEYDTLYVSPHIDDVTLSCPGHVLADRRAGRRALVLTLFSTDVPDLALASQPYRDRWAEEERALDALGADGVLAGLPDAPWRSPQAYGNFSGIVFGRDPNDLGAVGRAAELVARLVRRTRATRVLAPLGVGEHIDHRLAHEAARIAAADFRTATLRFYEDRPYASVPHATRLRLAALGLRSDAPDLCGAGLRELTAAFFFGLFRARYVQSFLHGTMNRVTVMARYGNQLQAAARDGLVVAPFETATFDLAVADAAAEAIGCYASQIGDVVGDSERWRKAALEWSARVAGAGAYVERLWALPDA